MLSVDSFENGIVCVAFLLGLVIVYNTSRERKKLSRCAILPTSASPWRKVLRDGDDQSFFVLLGMEKRTFLLLHSIVMPVETYSVEQQQNVGLEGRRRKAAGRPAKITSKDKLGLYLMFLNSRMNINELCLIFGVTPSNCSRVIQYVRDLICTTLATREESKIKFPNPEEMEMFAELIRLREPLVTNCIGFVDGVSIPVQCSSDISEQSAAYNGYYHDTMCNNVFAFGPNGKIIWAGINFPGSWHDSAVVENLVAICLKKIAGLYCFCVDQGFPRSGLLFDVFVGPLSIKSKRKLAPELREFVIRKHDRYVSLRQASEWGMRVRIQSTSRTQYAC